MEQHKIVSSQRGATFLLDLIIVIQFVDYIFYKIILFFKIRIDIYNCDNIQNNKEEQVVNFSLWQENFNSKKECKKQSKTDVKKSTNSTWEWNGEYS